MRLQIFKVPEDEGSLKVSNDVGSVSYHERNGGYDGRHSRGIIATTCWSLQLDFFSESTRLHMYM